MSPGALRATRLRHIEAMLRATGQVRTTDLAMKFGTSAATARRDITLAASLVPGVERVHGGLVVRRRTPTGT